MRNVDCMELLFLKKENNLFQLCYCKIFFCKIHFGKGILSIGNMLVFVNVLWWKNDNEVEIQVILLRKFI